MTIMYNVHVISQETLDFMRSSKSPVNRFVSDLVY